MSRLTKRNIIATISLAAGLSSLGFGFNKSFEVFGHEMNQALGPPTETPGDPPVEERNMLLGGGAVLLAIAGHQRVKHVSALTAAEKAEAVVNAPEPEIPVVLVAPDELPDGVVYHLADHPDYPGFNPSDQPPDSPDSTSGGISKAV